jgi:hypothetical protein
VWLVTHSVAARYQKGPNALWLTGSTASSSINFSRSVKYRFGVLPAESCSWIITRHHPMIRERSSCGEPESGLTESIGQG